MTTLQRNGPGSIEEAVSRKGARIIVFEVGGVIDLQARDLEITEPFLTIAGQTAPDPGITLIRGGVSVAAHDVIISHIRVRPGEAGHTKRSGWEPDAIGTQGAKNVIINNCSVSWATDEGLSASGPRRQGNSVEEFRRNTSSRITISNCIIAEGLMNSTHAGGGHSKGTLLHDNTTEILVLGNLFASNDDRNPMAKAGVEAVIVNNWITNPGRWAMRITAPESEWGGVPIPPARLVMVGNLVEPGRDTDRNISIFTAWSSYVPSVYMEDNVGFRDGNPLPQLRYRVTPLNEKPFWPEWLRPVPSDQVREIVSKHVGARPWSRDEVDQRIVEQALNGQGRIINSEADVGGYPKPIETRRPFLPHEWDLSTMHPVRGYPVR